MLTVDTIAVDWAALFCLLFWPSRQVLVNRGLLDFSKNEFVAAQENFRNAAAAAAKEEPPDDTDGKGENALFKSFVKNSRVVSFCSGLLRRRST